MRYSDYTPPSRGEVLRATMIKRFGSEEAWKEWMREIAAKGGRQTYESSQLNKVNFKANRELTARVGRIGGTISRRRKKAK